MEPLDGLLHQYLASLKMLEKVIAACPEPLWVDESDKNQFWHVAYHALFYTHLYSQPEVSVFQPWAKHRPDFEQMHTLGEPYTQQEILEYAQICRDELRNKLPLQNMEGPSGFFWLEMSKFELQLYSIRHLMQHTGELSDRLGNRFGIGVEWVSSEPNP